MKKEEKLRGRRELSSKPGRKEGRKELDLEREKIILATPAPVKRDSICARLV